MFLELTLPGQCAHFHNHEGDPLPHLVDLRLKITEDRVVFELVDQCGKVVGSSWQRITEIVERVVDYEESKNPVPVQKRNGIRLWYTH